MIALSVSIIASRRRPEMLAGDAVPFVKVLWSVLLTLAGRYSTTKSTVSCDPCHYEDIVLRLRPTVMETLIATASPSKIAVKVQRLPCKSQF